MDVTTKFYVRDMMCRQCEKTLEHAVGKVAGVKSVKADYGKGLLTVIYENGICAPNQIEQAVTASGYQNGKKAGQKWKKWLLAAGSLMAFLVGERMGIMTVFASFPRAEEGVGYVALLLTGLLTSVHCMAMCGGLSLSQSMKRGEQSSWRSSVLYNMGRVCSYTLTGALLGALGSVVSISVEVRAGIGLFAGICMLLMALNMLDLLPFLRKIPIPCPKRIQSGSAFLVGLCNGLMPCGPLQAMQLVAVASGSVAAGALSMFFFAIGTVPLMLLFGLAAGTLLQKWRSKMLLAGSCLILLFSVYMIQNNSALLGFGVPLAGGSTGIQAEKNEDVQYVTTTLKPNGYEDITVKAGIPVEWIIEAEASSLNGCNNEIRIPEYDLDIKLKPGENKITFLPEQPGDYIYSCWMGMLRATIHVTE